MTLVCVFLELAGRVMLTRCHLKAVQWTSEHRRLAPAAPLSGHYYDNLNGANASAQLGDTPLRVVAPDLP